MGNINLNESIGNTINNNDNKINNKIKISISISTIVVIVAILLIFSSSSDSISKKIIGRWQAINSEDIYEFTKDGQFIHLSGGNDGLTIKYSIDDNKMQLNVSNLFGEAIVFADVNISNNNLTLSNFIDPDDVLGLEKEDVLKFSKID